MLTREKIIEEYQNLTSGDAHERVDAYTVRIRCKQLAEIAHTGQKRSNGEDYIKHIYGVVDILNRHMGTLDLGDGSDTSRSKVLGDISMASTWELEEVLALAFLHDVVEDTELTMGDVDELVAGYFLYHECLIPRLESLTTVLPKGIKDRSIKVAIQENKALYMTEQAALVKMADRIHNLTDALGDWKYRKVVRYLLESENMMKILYNRFDRFDSWQLTVANRLRDEYMAIRDKIIQTDYDEFWQIRRELRPV